MIVDHLKAVRTLEKYVNGAGLKKDMEDFANYLRLDLSRDILRPAGWESLKRSEGTLYSNPLGISTRNSLLSKWSVLEDDVIAINIYPAGPVQDDDAPYVELYVPVDWNNRQQFIAELKPPPGFEHVSQYDDGELAETTSVFKYVKYEWTCPHF